MQPLLHKIAKISTFLDPGSLQVASCSLMVVCIHFCTSTRAVNRQHVAATPQLARMPWSAMESAYVASQPKYVAVHAQPKYLHCTKYLAWHMHGLRTCWLLPSAVVDKQKSTASQNTSCHRTTQCPSLLSLSMLAEARDDLSIVPPYNQNKQIGSFQEASINK
jgi:hypothetical protein